MSLQVMLCGVCTGNVCVIINTGDVVKVMSSLCVQVMWSGVTKCLLLVLCSS